MAIFVIFAKYSLITGVEDFLELVKDAEDEYERDYRVEYERLRKAKLDAEKVSMIQGNINHPLKT